MKAVRYDEVGGPEVMHVVEVPEPHAGEGQVRIAVHAAAVNPVDWKIRSGLFGPVDLPAGVGMDSAGVVDEVGPGVTGVAIGDEVFGSSAPGAAAEFVVLDEWAKKPESLSFEEAAGFVMASETARRALDLLAGTTGQTLLVNGAAGGVGLAAVQFAIADGMRVVGTASERNHEFLRSVGAIPVEYGDGLVGRVRQAAPGGVDVALDIAGSGVLGDLITLTGSADNVVTIADPAAADFGVRGTYGGDKQTAKARAEAAALFEQGKFTLPIAGTFPLEEVQAAHVASQKGHVLGKYVLKVR